MKHFSQFHSQHIKEFSADQIIYEILHLYLFEGYSVKKIESFLFGSEEWRGFLAKCVLNFYGIDTAPESNNKGIYRNETPSEVIRELTASSDPAEKQVGYALMKYHPKI